MNLPEVGAQSMASDWRVLPVPLRKRVCVDCGLVSSLTPPTFGLFEDGYSLYSHSPTSAVREQQRQQLYARWIAGARARAGASAEPRSVLDVGCGNGSLLLALGEHWPSSALLGCDPSAEAVAHADRARCRVWQGTSSSLAPDVQADLVVSVNVVEHTGDPVVFLRDLSRGLTAGGTLILICPDGAVPAAELLIADHAYSFAASHLREILERAELTPRHVEPAPAELGSFQMVIADTSRALPVAASQPSPIDVSRWHSYLQQWAALDGHLISRVGDGGVSCFGLGETAGLLRAYAPRTWQRVRSSTSDDITEPSRLGPVPSVPLNRLAADEPLLLAVRPQDQPGLAERLSSRFTRVISWHDLIEA